MRLIWGILILIVVSVVWTLSEAKEPETSQSPKSKVSHPAKHSSADHSKKPHQETVHKSCKHDHSKTTKGNKSKHEDKSKSAAKKTEKKKEHMVIQTTTKKPEHKSKHRHEGKRKTTALPVVIHRKQPGGSNVTNNGTKVYDYNPLGGSVIDAPFISCPEGQRRMKGDCKTVFS